MIYNKNKLLGIVISIQIALLGIIGLGYIGISIPILREILAVIYLTFIPGILILRILKFDKINNIEIILYSVGLSITSIMFVGLFINLIYPFIGISKPISLTVLILTFSILTAILCIINYFIDDKIERQNLRMIDISEIFSPYFLFLILIISITFLGTFIMNIYGNHNFIIILLLMIVTVFILIGFDKIPKKLYPVTVFLISLSLLYHFSMISNYVVGFDIQYELYAAKLVVTNSLWDLNLNLIVNGTLSVVMLAPIYSIISNIDLIWIYKLIYPAIFSLVPLGLFLLFKKQTNDKIAILSTILFISLFVFFSEMPSLARQEIAEFFLVLLALLLINNITSLKKSIIIILFTLSIVVSHYSLSYIYLIFLILYFVIFSLIRFDLIRNLLNKFRSKYTNFIDTNSTYEIKYTYVLLLLIFITAWYIYVSESSVFKGVLSLFGQITGSFYTEFLDIGSNQGMLLINYKSSSLLHNLTKYLHLIVQFFILIGIISLIKDKMKFNKIYIIFSIFSIFLLISSIIIPFVASSLNTSRIYQISLIFLAPFFIIGVLSMLKQIKVGNYIKFNSNNIYKILSIFLSIFLLFNTGFFYEIANDPPSSISLGNDLSYAKFNSKEVQGATWSSYYINNNTKIYSDNIGVLLLDGFKGKNSTYFSPDSDYLPPKSYVYLRSYNIINNRIFNGNPNRDIFTSTKFFNEVLINKNLIYSNGGSQVYF